VNDPDVTPVYLVGAGPGDPELLTVKARRLLDSAEVVLHDSLVGDGIVETLPGDTEVVDVGKRPDEGGRRWTQDEINRALARRAREGETVVRLKGGDATVFGRGGEEAAYLADRDIPFEFVPGVTSAVAGPALAGIPATHRDHASSLTVVTGHEDPTKAESALDWEALADTVTAGGTLVILMGVGRLPDNVDALRSAGVPGDTQVAFVERASWPDGEVTLATLETAVERRDEAGVEPPAVIVVGDVVGVRESLEDCHLSSVRLPEPVLTGTGAARDGSLVLRSSPQHDFVDTLDGPEP
jgi:uroporphyrin-III C-methyltransferase